MLVPEAGRRPSVPSLRVRARAPVVDRGMRRRASSSSTARARTRPRQHRPLEQDVYSMLLWVQHDRGYKPGYAEAKYMARYGKWPRGLCDCADGAGCAVPELAEVAGDRLPQASAEGGPACCVSLSKIARWAGGAGSSPSLGVPAKALTNRHGPCPICGGKDRFRFDDKGGRGTGYVHDAAPATASNW